MFGFLQVRQVLNEVLLWKAFLTKHRIFPILARITKAPSIKGCFLTIALLILRNDLPPVIFVAYGQKITSTLLSHSISDLYDLTELPSLLKISISPIMISFVVINGMFHGLINTKILSLPNELTINSTLLSLLRPKTIFLSLLIISFLSIS